jgi:protein gp37
MGDKSKIEWTDATWNPVTGCTKVSQGCKNCYAEREMKRFWPGRSFTDVQLHPDPLEQPLHWRRPRRVFVNSMSDLFHESVPDLFIARVFSVMGMAGQHTFQILTKRPSRMLEWFNKKPGMWPKDMGLSLAANIWLGVSCEDQETAEKRIPYLLATPAAVRFVSCEPLLGPINLAAALPGIRGELARIAHSIDQRIMYDRQSAPIPYIDWIIVGGESGPNARPMHRDWVRSLRDQCVAAEVPFFFKQWGEWAPRRELSDVARFASLSWPDHRFHYWDPVTEMIRVGKKNGGRKIDGREWMQYPEIR